MGEASKLKCFRIHLLGNPDGPLVVSCTIKMSWQDGVRAEEIQLEGRT